MKALNGNRAPKPAASNLQLSTLPPIPQQVRNLAAATTRALGAALTGRSVFAPPEIRAAREAICLVCSENLAGRCRKCGCGVRTQFLRKTHLATERCPLPEPKWLEWLQ